MDEKQYEESLLGFGKYYGDQITEAEDKMFQAMSRIKIQRKILEAVKEVWAVPLQTYGSMTFHCDSIEKARELTGVLLEKVEDITTFKKTMSTTVKEYQTDPEWYWRAEVDLQKQTRNWYKPKFYVYVYPAVPDPTCTPHIHFQENQPSVDRSWICNKR